MGRFFGKVGYGESQETAPGVFQDEIVEREYYGDEVRPARTLREGENLNPNISVNSSLSIMADAYAFEHFMNIKYVQWLGTLWSVTEVDVQRPRLVLRLGEVWNGQSA